MISLIKNQKGFAWIPVIIAILFGSTTVIGGSVAYNDYQTRREARANVQPEEAKNILREELNQFFNRYRKNCFSMVTSIGNRSVYQKALEDVILAYNQKRKTDAFAEYTAGAIFTGKPVKDLDLNNENERLEAQDTIWHELTHHLEVQNGDRNSWYALNPSRTTWKERNERHTEYMKYMLGILQQLMRIEKAVKNKEMTAEQIKANFKLLEKKFAEGSPNSFEATPRDLKEFSAYTGFHVNLKEIFDLYKKGTCLQFPEGTFEEEKDTEGEGDQTGGTDEAQKYVVWEGTNATVGIVITTKTVYETEEPASNYPGGGLDPNYIIKKELRSGGQTFATFEEAEKWICDQFTDIWFAPLGIGWQATYQGRTVFLANTSCGK